MGRPFLLYARVAVFSLLVIAFQAQAGPGWYVGSELGVTLGPSLGTVESSNDRASVCDEYINPLFRHVESTQGYEYINCTGPDRGVGDDWQNSFGSGEGIQFGLTLGYRGVSGSSFRAELEYFYRDAGYDGTSAVPGAGGASGDKLAQEIVTANEHIGSVTSHNLLTNPYFDFSNHSRLTPYIGLGVGLGWTEFDYGAVFQRNIDKNAIQTGAGLSNADAIREKLAGSTTTAQEALRHVLFGYQVLLGIDYAFTDSFSAGIKGRWINFEPFKDREERDTLRSHVSNLRLDGSEPVKGYLYTEDTEIAAVSMTLKYRS